MMNSSIWLLSVFFHKQIERCISKKLCKQTFIWYAVAFTGNIKSIHKGRDYTGKHD